MTRPVRRTLAASAAALSLLAFAGCGGGDDDSASDPTSSSSASASSSESTTTSESPSEEASESSDGGDSAAAGSEISASEFGDIMSTALDQATTANVTTTNSASGLDAKGQVDYGSDPASVKMTATIAQMGSIDVVLVDNVMYLKGAMFGDKYVSIDLKDPDNPLSSLGDQLDPAAAFDKLVSGITTATYVGEEDVAGESMKHYSTTIDSKVLLQDLPAAAQGQAGLPDSIDYQWWFDGDGNIRKFSADLGSTAGTVEGTFDDWGTDVDISAPPAAQVTTMPGVS